MKKVKFTDSHIIAIRKRNDWQRQLPAMSKNSQTIAANDSKQRVV